MVLMLNLYVHTCVSPTPFSPPQVFFIRDGMKFPDMVHAFKPNPKNHQQEAWRIMDFLSHHPESCHRVRGGGARGGRTFTTLLATSACTHRIHTTVHTRMPHTYITSKIHHS